jgi:hypothetical protein
MSQYMSTSVLGIAFKESIILSLSYWNDFVWQQ